jgi:2,7-dihydroxy-5-methyl-1-naphthoate 7-O-methyltransferase
MGVSVGALADLCTPWCLHTVVTLRIAERIDAGTTAIGELAAAAGCDPEALHNVLGQLVGKGVFEEPEPGRFALNPAARELLDPGVRIGLDLGGIGGRMAQAWGTLPSYVRTGQPAYRELFGRPFWEDLDAHPELAASFDALMGPTGHGTPDPDISLVDGWDAVRTVVDVGGGTGAMLAEILRARPAVRGTLVDLPRTVARADGCFEAAGVADRAGTVGQSFFDPLPAGADLYLLNGILNDWPDRETAMILRRCAEAARPAGRIVVMGGVVPDGAPPRLTIEMVLLGGRNSTLAEFRDLAAGCGLAVRAAHRHSSGRYTVECRPV